MFTCVCVSMHTHTHVRGGRDPDQRAIDFHKVKECSNCLTILLILHASKIMHKILQVRLQQYMSRELPEVQAGFRKGRGSRDQIANIHWITEKKKKNQGNSRETSTSASLTMLKPLTMWITTNWTILKEMGIPDHLTCILRNLCAGQKMTVRTRQGTGLIQNWERVYQGCIWLPCLFNFYTEYFM